MLNIVSNRLIANDEVVIDIVDNGTFDIGVPLQHVEEHRTATDKRLDVCGVVPTAEIGWQQRF